MHQVHPLLGLFETLPHPVDVGRVQGRKRHRVELQAISVHEARKENANYYVCIMLPGRCPEDRMSKGVCIVSFFLPCWTAVWRALCSASAPTETAAPRPSRSPPRPPTRMTPRARPSSQWRVASPRASPGWRSALGAASARSCLASIFHRRRRRRRRFQSC